MTKGPPRNRPGNGGKSGGFRGRGGRDGGDSPRSRGPGGDAPGGDRDKPWVKSPHPGGGREKPEERRQGDGPRRFEGKRSERPDRPRGDFRGKPRSDFGRGEHRGPRQGGGRPQYQGHQDRREAAFEENGEVWIWGIHAGTAALNNPMRKISTALITRNAAERAGLDLNALPRFVHVMEPGEIDLKLPLGAVHQGLAVRCRPFDGIDIAEAAARPEKPLVILDQVTDPQNVGAIFRSAAAFGIAGVVMQTRNAPALGGALAKAATGAIEKVDEIRAVNLSRAIDALVDAGWKVVGLDGTAEQTLDEAFAGDEPLAIVMGAEGAGLRHGVAKACSSLARIPIGVEMESLNVSNAAAIAFYEAARRGGRAVPSPRSTPLPPSGDDAYDDGFDDEVE